jgi:hypothetical protein
MNPYSFASNYFVCMPTVSLFLLAGFQAQAQATAALQGRVVDSNEAFVARVTIIAHNEATGLERLAETDSEGSYQIVALPVGIYRLEVRAFSFKTQIVDGQKSMIRFAHRYGLRFLTCSTVRTSDTQAMLWVLQSLGVSSIRVSRQVNPAPCHKSSSP